MRKIRLLFLLPLLICRMLMAQSLPVLTNVSLSSNNANPQRAKLGDSVFLKFTVSNGIPTPTVLMEDKVTSVINTNGNNWVAKMVVDETIEDGYIIFKIQYGDFSNSQNMNLNATTDSSMVIVDNVAPFIISVGRQNPSQQKTLQTTLVYRVTFSEEVNNVNAAAFKFNTIGDIIGTITGINKISATIYDVTVAITDGGTIGLELNEISGITDLSSNALSTAFNTKQTYIINSAPKFIKSTDPTSLIACINEDLPLSDTLTVFDLDLNQVITWSINQLPKNGTLVGFPFTATNYFGNVVPDNIFYKPNNNFLGNDTFSIKVSDGILTKKLNIYLSVHPLPVLTLSVNNTKISKGQYAYFTATGEGNFKWRPAFAVEDSTAAITKARIIDTTTFMLTLTNSVGCSTSDTITINSIEDYYVNPSIVFSPNGDGINDKFVIDNIDVYPSNKVQVIDRNGKIIFEKENYGNDWNGFVNNRILVKDTYFYVIWTNGHIAKRGAITVVM